MNGLGQQRVVFHIGLHKTATTALQFETFPRMRGINYPSRTSPRVTGYLNTVIATDPIYYRTRSGPADNDLLEELVTDRCNLASEEGLSGPPWIGIGHRGVDHRTPILMNLRNDFPDAEIILVIRRQDALARALYHQYVATGGTEPVARFLGEVASRSVEQRARRRTAPLLSRDRHLFSPYVAELQAAFPRGVHVIPYELLRDEPDVFMGRLCGIIGTPVLTAPPVRNRSRLGPTTLLMSRWSNRLFRGPLSQAAPIPGFPVRRRERWTSVNPARILSERWPGRNQPRSEVGDARFEAVLEGCRTDNARLERMVGEDLRRYGYW